VPGAVAVAPLVSMAITVPVTGTYTDNGAPASGTVTFTLSAPLQDAAGRVIATTTPVVADLDGDGQVNATLFATDGADTRPVGLTYVVTERISGASVRTYRIEVPGAFAAVGIDLAAAAPVVDATVAYGGPPGPAGPAGGDGADGTVVHSGSGAPSDELGAPGDFYLDLSNADLYGPKADDDEPWGVPVSLVGPAGPIGGQGVAGPVGPVGPAGLEWRGVWDDTEDYNDGDAVFHAGSSWFAAGDPEVLEEPSEASSAWQPLAVQGAPGVQGPAGPQGERGESVQGPKGDTGDSGVANATAPVTYNPTTKTVGLATGVGLTTTSGALVNTGIVTVTHGSTASTARPSGAAVVYWRGSVEPTNALNGDLWYDTSGD
jgi:hypothetical protein